MLKHSASITAIVLLISVHTLALTSVHQSCMSVSVRSFLKIRFKLRKKRENGPEILQF
jgi:hypothetical protein